MFTKRCLNLFSNGSMDSWFRNGFPNDPKLKSKLTYKIVFNMSYNKCPNFISNVSNICSGFVVNILSNTKATPQFSKITYNIVSKHNYKHCFHISFRIMLCQSPRLSKRNLTARKSNFLIGRVVRNKTAIMVHTWSCISTSVLLQATGSVSGWHKHLRLAVLSARV